MQLCQAAEQYLLERVVGHDYANQIRHRVGHFAAFAGNPPIAAIAADSVNRWIGELLESGLHPKTVKGYRGAVLAVWRWAFEVGMTDARPERIRRISVPHQTPQCWTHEELRALLKVIGKMKRNVLHTSIPRALWWAAFVHLGYSTGLRLGDLLALEWSQIRGDCVCVTQAKTGRIVCRPLTDAAQAALDALPRLESVVLPWPGATTGLFNQLRRLVRKAGIRPGTSRYLRRSAASYVERDHPGMAGRFLGHLTPGLAAKHYLDPAITRADVVRPPEL